jgi:hypothetical protein
MDDPDTLAVRIHHLLLGDPDMWKSLLQTETLSAAANPEYVCLSQAARKAIPIRASPRDEADGFPSWTTDQRS